MKFKLLAVTVGIFFNIKHFLIMSNRKQEFKSTSRNPATKFIEWKSDLGCFAYYDKAEGKNVEMPKSFKFLTLKEMHTVRGWDKKSQSGIYANEVQDIKDTLTVKSFKGGLIAKGTYSEIKETIAPKGGHYSKSIYAMIENGSVINIQLKGGGVQAWGEFTNKTRRRLTDEWVEIVGSENHKSGRIEYTTPVFQFSGTLSTDAEAKADAAYDNIEEYLKGYYEQPSVEQEEVAEDVGF